MFCSRLGPVEKPEATIKVYRRRNEAGEIVSWFARIKIPGTSRIIPLSKAPNGLDPSPVMARSSPKWRYRHGVTPGVVL
jgi:hypothetical protein